jgi:hypothetical protein|tara:strand:- start:631 stop:1158 length:528 start_codon:yes stop_codon:yes gene_type:complete
MKRSRGTISVGILVVFSFMSAILNWGGPKKDVSRFKTMHWNYSPIVRLCHEAPVDIQQVAKAANWWRGLGYDFDLIYTSHCEKISTFATITITLDQGELLMNDAFGRTTLYHNVENGNIYSATIQLKSPYVDRVLEHELGHALGWLHVDSIGHMMHSLYYQGGWDSHGLPIVAND